jgi:hypothetical protein
MIVKLVMVMICGSEARVNTSSCCQSSCGGGYRLVELVFWGFWLDSWGKQGRVTQVGTSVVQGWLRLVDTVANPITWLCLFWAGFGLWTENIIMSYSVSVWAYVIANLWWKLGFIFSSLSIKGKKEDRFMGSPCCLSLSTLRSALEPVDIFWRSLIRILIYVRNLVLFNFLHSVITTWWTYERELRATLAAPDVGS